MGARAQGGGRGRDAATCPHRRRPAEALRLLALWLCAPAGCPSPGRRGGRCVWGLGHRRGSPTPSLAPSLPVRERRELSEPPGHRGPPQTTLLGQKGCAHRGWPRDPRVSGASRKAPSRRQTGRCRPFKSNIRRFESSVSTSPSFPELSLGIASPQSPQPRPRENRSELRHPSPHWPPHLRSWLQGKQHLGPPQAWVLRRSVRLQDHGSAHGLWLGPLCPRRSPRLHRRGPLGPSTQPSPVTHPEALSIAPSAPSGPAHAAGPGPEFCLPRQ